MSKALYAIRIIVMISFWNFHQMLSRRQRLEWSTPWVRTSWLIVMMTTTVEAIVVIIIFRTVMIMAQVMMVIVNKYVLKTTEATLMLKWSWPSWRFPTCLQKWRRPLRSRELRRERERCGRRRSSERRWSNKPGFWSFYDFLIKQTWILIIWFVYDFYDKTNLDFDDYCW